MTLTAEHAAQRLLALPEYQHYAAARQTADRASPIEMPKADGMLRHAEAQLKACAVAMGLSAHEARQALQLLSGVVRA